ncbi:jg23920, partial [Pararge aegeria aegeria]
MELQLYARGPSVEAGYALRARSI